MVAALTVATVGPAAASGTRPFVALPADDGRLAVAAGLIFSAPLGLYDLGSDVDVFDSVGAEVASISGLPDVRALVAAPDGHSVFAALGNSAAVAVIDVATLRVTAQYDLSGFGIPSDMLDVGNHLYVRYTTGADNQSGLGVIDLTAATPSFASLLTFSDLAPVYFTARRTDAAHDEIYLGACEFFNPFCTVTRYVYSDADSTAAPTSDTATIDDLNSLIVSYDGAHVLTSEPDGTIQVRDPESLAVTSSFAGAAGGGQPVARPDGIVQAAGSDLSTASALEVRSLDGTLEHTYSDGTVGVSVVAAPDGSALLALEPGATSGPRVVLYEGSLRTGPAMSGTGVTPTAAGMFVSTAPTRVLDTRAGLGGRRPAGRESVRLSVTGHAPLPAGNVSAVVLTLTATGESASGYLTAYAGGGVRPIASNLNFTAGHTVANLVTVPVGRDGSIDVYNGSAGATDVVADVAGYYLGGTPQDAGAFAATPPTRILDTRGHPAVPSKGEQQLNLFGSGPIPYSGVSAVVLNVTVAGAAAPGYVTVYPLGFNRPTASNLNFTTGQTVANAVTVPVGTDGHINLYNGASKGVNLVVDVTGYYLDGATQDAGAFVATLPTRVLDTRLRQGAGKLAARSSATLTAAGRLPVPRGAAALLINATAVAPAVNGYLSLYPDDVAAPTASSLNFSAGATTAGLVNVRVGDDGSLVLHNGATKPLDVVGDIAGYFLAGPAREVAPNAARTIETTPAVQGGGPAGCAAAPYPFLGRTSRLVLGAYVSDPNTSTGDALRAHFRLVDTGTTRVPLNHTLIGFGDDAGRSASVSGAGGMAYVFLDPEALGLVDGDRYVVDEQTDDGTLHSAAGGSCTFQVDQQSPTVPTVTGPTSYHVGTSARFMLSTSDPSPGSGIDHFVYSTSSSAELGGDGGTRVPVNQNQSSATLTLTPNAFGTNYLYVAAVDKAGNESAVSTTPYYVAG